VELNRAEVGLVVPRLPADMRDWMRDGRVHLRFADPRRFLEEAGAYDLVMVGMPEPLSGQANRFYTREFFAACASRMRPGGILALRLQNGENFWTPAMKGRVESIYAALRSVFPEVVFLPGDSNVVTASSAPLPTDPEVLIGRLRSRGIRTTLVRPPYIRYLYSNDRYSEIRRMLKNAGAPPNTDLRPVCYRYTVVIWLSKFFPSLASGGPPARSAISTRSAGPWVAGGALAVLFCVARRRGRLRRIMLAGVAGFAGMALESVLILYYQVKQGILYQDIGLLLMSFMAGLALGAFATEKAITAGGGTRRVKSFAIGLLVGFSLLCGLVSLQLAASGAEAGLARTILLLVSSGFAVAGIFTCASRYDTGLPSLADRNGWEEEARATGKGERWGEEGDALAPLYGADLAGGCLGALLAGLLMIPLAGLPSTTLWTALSALLALLLV
jgi:spermidine synthase